MNAAFAPSQNVTHSETTSERWQVTRLQTTTSSSTHSVTAARGIGQMPDVTEVPNVVQSQEGTQSQDVTVSNEVDQREQIMDRETRDGTGFGTADSKGSAQVIAQLVVCACSMVVMYCV